MRGTAVVFEDKDRVSVRGVEVPNPSPRDVVIDVEYSWISIGTESSFLRGERSSGEQPYQKGDRWPFPNVAGYQKVGIVRDVGKEVTGFKAGDRVFASVSKVSGMAFDHGGHISPAVTPCDQVWRLPNDSTSEDFAGTVLTQVGYNCAMRPQFQPGEAAVVIGDGLVGQWTAQTLKHRGANVIVLGRHDERLSFLPGNIQAINTTGVALRDVFSQIGRIQVLVDTVGDLQTCFALQPLMNRNSHLVSAGFLGDHGTVDIQSLRNQEITLHCPSGWTTERMEQTIAAISSGWLQTSKLITHRFSVTDAVAAWTLIQQGKSSVLGVLLDWTS